MYSFAHMKLDEDARLSESQGLSDKGMKLIVETNEKTSFLIPEILSIEDVKLEGFFKESPELELYRHELASNIRYIRYVFYFFIEISFTIYFFD